MTPRKGHLARSVHQGHAGFTLLEVLLVIVLSVLLVAGVWSLLGVYIGLFEKGESRTEHAQLVRSLMRQISDDLHEAIQDVAPRPPQLPATAPLRRFGLFGSSQSLQMDILRVAPSDAIYLPKETVTLATTEETPVGPKAPEFRTVQYEFVSPPDETEEAQPLESEDVQAGLTRRELDWEIPEMEQSGGDLSGTTTSGSEPLSADRSGPGDDTALYVPEVVSLQFRYFDGQTWTSQWNSIERKALPAAIEVTLQVQPPESPSQRRLHDLEGKGTRRDSSSEGEAESEESRIRVHDAAEQETVQEGPSLPIHRMVVYLSVSPLQKPAVAEAGSSVTVRTPGLRGPRPERPLPTVDFAPAPMPVIPENRPRGPAASSDQHLRNSGVTP